MIACEESQTECIAFRSLGCEAYSCDLQQCSGGHPEWHVVGDATSLLRGGQFHTQNGDLHFVECWDLLIAHPPCTYLTNTGARHLWRGHQLQPDRVMLGIQARDLFLKFWWADIPKVVVENPVPSKIFCLPPYTQIVQPFWFGHPVTKKTCLWERGVPELIPTNMVEPVPGRIITRSDGTTRRTCWVMDVTGQDRAKLRSKAFQGMADAMALQWGSAV